MTLILWIILGLAACNVAGLVIIHLGRKAGAWWLKNQNRRPGH